MSVIKMQQLSKRYGHRVGIDAVDLDVAEGETFGFLGPNGAGKTTTIRLLLGFLRPSQGHASVFGLDCWRKSPQIKRDVGYLPGDLRLYSWLTVRKTLEIVGRVRGLDLRKEGAILAERFQLEMDLRVRKMSRGMRQKLGIIMALAHKPRLLVLDEPSSGLDPLMQAELSDCLREFTSDGHTVFLSSHTLSEVESLCDRVAIVRRGQIIADQPLQSLRDRALRIVEILFPDQETADRVKLPTFMTLDRRDGRRFECELEGPTQPLIEWAARQEIEDISIGKPDLERLFHKYYQSPSELQ